MMDAALTVGSDPLRPVNAVVAELERCYSMIQIWQQAEEKSEYQIDKLLSILREQECEIPRVERRPLTKHFPPKSCLTACSKLCRFQLLINGEIYPNLRRKLSMKRSLPYVILCLLLLGLFPAVSAQQPTPQQAQPPKQEVLPVYAQNIKGNIYQVKGGWVPTPAFYRWKGSPGHPMPKWPRMQQNRWLREIKKLTPNPISTITLTHSDGDHVNGLVGFPQGTNIISHEKDPCPYGQCLSICPGTRLSSKHYFLGETKSLSWRRPEKQTHRSLFISARRTRMVMPSSIFPMKGSFYRWPHLYRTRPTHPPPQKWKLVRFGQSLEGYLEPGRWDICPRSRRPGLRRKRS